MSPALKSSSDRLATRLVLVSWHCTTGFNVVAANHAVTFWPWLFIISTVHMFRIFPNPILCTFSFELLFQLDLERRNTDSGPFYYHSTEIMKHLVSMKKTLCPHCKNLHVSVLHHRSDSHVFSDGLHMPSGPSVRRYMSKGLIHSKNACGPMGMFLSRRLRRTWFESWSRKEGLEDRITDDRQHLCGILFAFQSFHVPSSFGVFPVRLARIPLSSSNDFCSFFLLASDWTQL